MHGGANLAPLPDLGSQAGQRIMTETYPTAAIGENSRTASLAAYAALRGAEHAEDNFS